MKTKAQKKFRQLLTFSLAIFCFHIADALGQDTSKIVNDITQLNPIRVNSILQPTTTAQIVNAVKNNVGPISIGGGRYSMGGQTATENALQIDMRTFDKVLYFSKKNREVTVQTGITWRKLLDYIDTAGLSIKIMQSYANFTVGGALSVNCHGRYIGLGPIILSVKNIKVVLANGDLVEASCDKNAEVFYGAIGGYGGLGVITEATLYLTNNCKVERTDTLMRADEYKKYFFEHIRNDSTVVFQSADIYPNRYNRIRSVPYRITQKDVTVPDRTNAIKPSYGFNKFAYTLISGFPGGKWIREHIIDPYLYRKNPVEWRNYEAGSNVQELEPKSRKKSTYVLEEYFVPVDNFNSFYPAMGKILRDNDVNVINISIRNARPDSGTLLAWARTEVFSFVIYYKQGTSDVDKEKVKLWTRQLIEVAIANNGSYYLPYQIHATPEQFSKAYPNSQKFFDLKKQLDPTNKFRNKLWDAYYK
jgi:FAD/FMN-containing dehydrogenase